MPHIRATIFSSFRYFVLLAACLTGVSHADEYSDVNQLIRTGQLTEATRQAEAYLSSKPHDPQMRFLNGVIKSTAGEPIQAIAIFTKLTEDYPELPEPYNNLAVLYAQQDQLDKARTALEMAIRTNPGYATAYENLGDVYAALASQAYSKALQLGSTSAALALKLTHSRELLQSPLKN